MPWKYGQKELESWLGAHLSSAQIKRLKAHGKIGRGEVRSKKEMDALLELVAEQPGVSKSKLRRLRWEVRNSAVAKKYLPGAGSHGRHRGPSAIDVKHNRILELREKVGQEHYLIKYKAGTAKERAKLRSKRISDLAEEGQAWREREDDEDAVKTPMERAQHRAALNRTTQRRTRLDF